MVNATVSSHFFKNYGAGLVLVSHGNMVFQQINQINEQAEPNTLMLFLYNLCHSINYWGQGVWTEESDG